MDISAILMAASVVAVVGIVVGLVLGIADLKLHVDVDEKEARVLEALPRMHSKFYAIIITLPL